MKSKRNKLTNFLKLGILFFGISILLWNCEKETFIPSEEIIAETNNEIDFKIENLTFKQASSEVIFSNLKNNFDIEEPTFNTKKGGYFSKVKKGLSKTSKDFSDLDASIDMNSLKKITTQDYTSYTMRLVEPQNTTSTFSNVVVQESNGVQEIFTFRYTPIENQSKTAIRTSSFEGTYTMTKGICLPDQIGDCSNNEDTGGGGGGDFVEICNTVTIITSVGCQCSHQPGNYCAGCGGPGTNHYSTETREECYWDYVGNNGTSGTGSAGGTSTAGGSSSNNGNNVITIPINEVVPEGVDPKEWFEDQIFIDQNFKGNSCLKSVYDQMGKATKFKEYLQNFEATASVADLRFTTDDNFSGNEDVDYHNAMAITKPPLANNEIKIKFNTDTSTTGNILNKPDVFKAVSMIHEMIHAEMYRKMLDAVKAAEINQTNLQWDTWPNNTDFEDFIESLQNKYFGIFDFYTRFEWNTSNPSSAQHQLMADRYRNIIKQALTDYDSTLTNTQKEALSWIGLNEANVVAWQNYSNKTSVTSILTTIKNTFPNGCN